MTTRKKACSCSWPDCSELQQKLTDAGDPLWGGTLVKIVVTKNELCQELVKSIIYHLNPLAGLKEYRIARHHWTRELLQLHASSSKKPKWITPLSCSIAKSVGITDKRDAIDARLREFARAPCCMRTTVVSHVEKLTSSRTKRRLIRNVTTANPTNAATISTCTPDPLSPVRRLPSLGTSINTSENEFEEESEKENHPPRSPNPKRGLSEK